jgi:hypothetical protein
MALFKEVNVKLHVMFQLLTKPTRWFNWAILIKKGSASCPINMQRYPYLYLSTSQFPLVVPIQTRFLR